MNVMLLPLVRKMAKSTFVHVLQDTKDLEKCVMTSTSVTKVFMIVIWKPYVLTLKVDLSALATMNTRETVDNVRK